MLVSQLRLGCTESSQQDESPGLGWTFLGGRYESAGLNLAACITLHSPPPPLTLTLTSQHLR